MKPNVASLVDEGLGNSSYLVEIGDGRALAVDPRRDPAPYLDEASRRGWAIEAVVETHLHADFISGGRELASFGADLYAPEGSDLTFAHHPLAAGSEIDLGDFTLRALSTPGHTPEHLAYLLSEVGRPLALFSGGSLLVGGVARTDLIAPHLTETLTRQLFHSLRRLLEDLPDDLPIYPTHGEGSFCSAGRSGNRTTTLGVERANNPYLAVDDEDQFVAAVRAGLGSYPRYFRWLRDANRQGPPLYGTDPPLLELLTPERVSRLVEDGAVVVDVRPVADWAAAHLPGSISIHLRPAFASWLGWVVDIHDPLVFVTRAETDRSELVRSCLSIGYERLAGELAGGVAAWVAAGYPTRTTPMVGFEGLQGQRLIDVRQLSEWETGHIPDAVHIELGDIEEFRPQPGSLAVHCQHGERAATGASLLERQGQDDVTLLMGGPADWVRANPSRMS